MLKLLDECDALRRPERFSELLLACQCDAQGRTGLEEKPYPQRDYLEAAREATAGAALPAEEMKGLAGPAIARAIAARRLQALTELKAGRADPAH